MVASSTYSTVISLHIEANREDGFYAISSKDLPGLVLGGKDLFALLKDVPAAIALLFKLNYGLKVQVTPADGKIQKTPEPKEWQPLPHTFVAVPAACQ